MDNWVVAVVISVTKEGVMFSTRGDIGTANIVCRQNTSIDKVTFSAVESLICSCFEKLASFTCVLDMDILG